MDYDIEKDEYMKDWKEVRLGDVALFKNGKKIEEKERNSFGSYNIFGSNGIIGKTEKHLYPKEVIIIGRVGAYCGAIEYSRDKCWVTDNAIACLNNEYSESKYLYYIFKTLNFRKRAGGSAQPLINQSILNEIIINLPPLPTQQKIAQILSSLDDKIELNNAINKNLEEIAQTLFKQWFVDFEFPASLASPLFQGGDREGDGYKSNGGEMVESEWGEIPKGWRVGILGDIANITSGKRPIEKSDVWSNEFNIPLIGASKIMGYTTNYLLNSKILIIGRVGTHGVVQKYSEPIWPSDNTLVIDSINYEYVYNILKIIDYRSLNRGSTQPLITQTDVKNTKIIIAPNEVHNAFERLINAFNNLQNNNNIETQTLTKLRDELLPKLMSGEVRV